MQKELLKKCLAFLKDINGFNDGCGCCGGTFLMLDQKSPIGMDEYVELVKELEDAAAE